MDRPVDWKIYPATSSSTKMNGSNLTPLALHLVTSPTTAKIYTSRWSGFPLIHFPHFAYIPMTHYLSRLTALLSQRLLEQALTICTSLAVCFLRVTPTKLATGSSQVASGRLVMRISTCILRPTTSCRSPSRQMSAATLLTLLLMVKTTGYLQSWCSTAMISCTPRFSTWPIHTRWQRLSTSQHCAHSLPATLCGLSSIEVSSISA